MKYTQVRYLVALYFAELSEPIHDENELGLVSLVCRILGYYATITTLLSNACA